MDATEHSMPSIRGGDDDQGRARLAWGHTNLSDTIRSIPNLEFYAPWFREPTVPGISYDDFKKLSPEAQRAVRFSVADSSETLDTGVTMRAP